MRLLSRMSVLVLLLFLSGCTTDTSELEGQVNDLETQISALEVLLEDVELELSTKDEMTDEEVLELYSTDLIEILTEQVEKSATELDTVKVQLDAAISSYQGTVAMMSTINEQQTNAYVNYINGTYTYEIYSSLRDDLDIEADYWQTLRSENSHLIKLLEESYNIKLEAGQLYVDLANAISGETIIAEDYLVDIEPYFNS